MSSVYITGVPLAYAVTASAYNLQRISDEIWMDSIPRATKLANIASIRHYRASNMMRMKVFVNGIVSFDVVDKDSELEAIIDNFCAVENVIEKKVDELIEDYNSKKLRDELNRFKKMFIYTRSMVAYSASPYDNNKIPVVDDDKFMHKFVCLQCGEIFNTNNDDCSYCEAGMNHLSTIFDMTY